MGIENDFGLQDPIVYTQARCDEAGEEHRDGSNVGFVSILRDFRVPKSPPSLSATPNRSNINGYAVFENLR